MTAFSVQVLGACATTQEVVLTTRGRTSGWPHRVTIWISTDGQHLYIRSGGGLGRDWPQNLLANGRAILHVGGQDIPVQARHLSDAAAARRVSTYVAQKYGARFGPSPDDESLSSAEQATFELLPGGGA